MNNLLKHQQLTGLVRKPKPMNLMGTVGIINKKPVFPVIYSTLEPKALINHVVKQYLIDQIVDCQFWHRGLSDVYLVETQSDLYILRVSHHHWRDKSELNFELELLKYLHQQGIPVAYPLRTREGNLLIEINAPEGNRYASLFTYARGNVVLGDLNQTQSFLLGETLAKIHQISQGFRTHSPRQPLTLEYLLDQSLENIAPFFSQRKCELAYLIETTVKISNELKNIPREQPFWVICWGDPHSGNVHFTPNNQITLFDFDQCGYGWRAFDIGKFLQISVRTGLSKKIREAFLAGYESISPISDLEFFSLKAFTQTAHIWMWAINLNEARLWNFSQLDHYYFTHRLEQLKQLDSPNWQPV